jgi:hypothetical protein
MRARRRGTWHVPPQHSLSHTHTLSHTHSLTLSLSHTHTPAVDAMDTPLSRAASFRTNAAASRADIRGGTVPGSTGTYENSSLPCSLCRVSFSLFSFSVAATLSSALTPGTESCNPPTPPPTHPRTVARERILACSARRRPHRYRCSHRIRQRRRQWCGCQHLEQRRHSRTSVKRDLV